MVRRWLIRLPFLLALALVVGVWIASHREGIQLSLNVHGHSVHAKAVEGLGMMIEIAVPTIAPIITFERPARARDWGMSYANLGFTCLSGWPSRDVQMIGFPLWFPTLLLLALNWFVWRKTRLKPVSQAFPVEMEKKETEKI